MRENRTYGSARVCASNGTFYLLVMKCMKVHGAKDQTNSWLLITYKIPLYDKLESREN